MRVLVPFSVYDFNPIGIITQSKVMIQQTDNAGNRMQAIECRQSNAGIKCINMPHKNGVRTLVENFVGWSSSPLIVALFVPFD